MVSYLYNTRATCCLVQQMYVSCDNVSIELACQSYLKKACVTNLQLNGNISMILNNCNILDVFVNV